MRTTTALTLCLLAITPTIQAQAPGIGTTDLEVETIQAPDPIVGRNSIVSATVRNHADTDTVATVTFSWKQEGQPLNSDMATIEPQTVPAHSILTFDFPGGWTPDHGQAGNGTIIARVTPTVAADDDPTDNILSIATFVIDYSITLEQVESSNANHVSRRVPEPGTNGHFQSVIIPFRIQNNGNVPDIINVTSVIEPNPDQWTTNLTHGWYSLAPGQSAIAYATLRPPPDATPKSEPESGLITATSEGYRAVLREDERQNPATQRSVQLVTPDIRVSNDLENNFSVQARGPTNIHLEAGGSTGVALTIENSNTTWDVYNITPRLAGPAAPDLSLTLLTSDVNATRPQIALPPLGSITIHYRIDATHRLIPNSTATLAFDVNSTNWNAANRGLSIHVHATAIDLTVDSIAPPPAIYRGSNATITISGRNNGSLAATNIPVSVRVFDIGAWINLTSEPTNISSAPNSTWSFTIPLTATRTALMAGRYIIEARADPTNNATESNETNNILTSELFVRTVDIRLTQPDPQEVHPGQRLDLTQGGPAFYVTNHGNHAEHVILAITSANGLYNAEGRREIHVGQTLAIPISINVPSRPGVTRDTMHAIARLEGLSTKTAEANATLLIRDNTAPIIEARLPSEATVGDVIQLQAIVTDESNITRVEALLTQPDGTTQILLLDKSGTDTYRATLRARAVGLLTIVIRATDASTSSNENQRPPAKVQINPPGQPPSIKIDGLPNYKIIGPGGNVQINAIGTGALTLSYAIDAGPLVSLVAPYIISTNTWTEGPHELRVIATDAYNRTIHISAQLQKDVTPPRITDTKIERLDSGLLRVTVQVTDNAERGFLRHDSTGMRTNLTFDKALNQYRADIEASENQKITIVLEDSAGNIASRTLDAPSAKTVPAPFAGILALIVVLALRKRPSRASFAQRKSKSPR